VFFFFLDANPDAFYFHINMQSTVMQDNTLKYVAS